jgi:hypothetical protein
MKLPERPRRRQDLIFREIDEDFVIYDPVTDHTLLLNVSSAAVLELCDGSRTLGDMVDEVAAAFGVEPGEVCAEVEASLEGFARRDFFAPE